MCFCAYMHNCHHCVYVHSIHGSGFSTIVPKTLIVHQGKKELPTVEQSDPD